MCLPTYAAGLRRSARGLGIVSLSHGLNTIGQIARRKGAHKDTIVAVTRLGEAGHNTELGVADMLSARAWLAFPTFRLGHMTGLADNRTACPA